MSVVFKTTHGDIEIELFWRQTPKTCRNFVELCKDGYYDGLVFHVSHSRLAFLTPEINTLIQRVCKGYFAQTGDPLGNNTDVKPEA